MILNSGYPTSLNVIFPSPLIAGDTWTITAPLGRYTDPGWTATLTFAAGSSKISANATTDASNWIFTVPATDTAKAPTGTNQYSIMVANSVTGEVYTLQIGGVTVIANPTSATWVNTESMLTKQLAAADQTLLDLLSQRTSMVSFGGKQYYMWNIADLWKVRNELAARVAAENEQLLGNRRSNRIIPWFVENVGSGQFPGI